MQVFKALSRKHSPRVNLYLLTTEGSARQDVWGGGDGGQAGSIGAGESPS